VSDRRKSRACAAIGPGGRLPRRVLLRRGAAALALVVLLALAQQAVSWQAARTSAETEPGQVIAAGLIVGAPPADYDLEDLASSLRVDGVVDVGPPSIAEQVTARSLHLAYLYVAVPTNGSPTLSELNDLNRFIRENTSDDKEVYMHDDGTWARVTTTAAMLLMLRGQSWTSVSARLAPAELRTMCVCQRRAVARFGSALARSASHRDTGSHTSARRS
jgi:hypothetical protein